MYSRAYIRLHVCLIVYGHLYSASIKSHEDIECSRYRIQILSHLIGYLVFRYKHRTALSLPTSLRLSLCVSPHLSVYVSVSLCLHPSLCLCLCLSVSLPISLSMSLSLCVHPI